MATKMVSVASQAPLGIGMLVMSGLSFAAVVGVYQLLPTEQDMDDKTCDRLHLFLPWAGHTRATPLAP